MNGIIKNPLLSITIPTYNRPNQIIKQIKRLLPQLNEYVQVTIYDNCSLHPVHLLFSDDDKKKIYIKRNKTNIGADANIAKCFEECETKWLWVLSDDDFVADDAINKVISQILNNCMSFTYISFIVYKKDIYVIIF